MKKIILSAVVALVVILVSCSKDGGLWYSHNWEKDHPHGQAGQGCDTSGVISYSTTIQPIINQNCATAGCHDGSGALDYTAWANVSADAQNTHPVANSIMVRIGLPTSDPSH